jgi:hypothetical protein
MSRQCTLGISSSAHYCLHYYIMTNLHGQLYTNSGPPCILHTCIYKLHTGMYIYIEATTSILL